ncbi:IS1182 family transposase [bacterium]|nr:IS1182 family transposase [bacterium]
MSETSYQATLNTNKKIKITDFSPSHPKPKVVFKPYSQNQEFLLPKNVDDFIGAGHIARLISQIIDEMDLLFILDTYKGGGTSSYNPRMMLKSWILAFIYRIYSSRLVAKNLRENLSFIWISGNQTPDFHTLNDFRLRLKDDIKKIFKQIVKFALDQGIIQAKDIFIDHTKNEANANKHKIVWRKQVEKHSIRIDEELDDLFKYIDEINEKEEKTFGGKDLPEQERNGFDDEKVKQIIDKINNNVKEGKTNQEDGREQRKKVRRTKELLERKKVYNQKKHILNGRNSYSKTDHDAVGMMMKDQLTIRPGYNEGIAVENGFVLNYVISDNCADNVSFIPLMDGMIDNLGRAPENVNADGAYGTEENHRYLEKKRTNNYLKFNTYHREKSQKWRDKKIRLQNFSYDEKNNQFICPNNIKLMFVCDKQDITKTGYIRNISSYKSKEGACKYCRLKKKCLNEKNMTNTRTLQFSWLAERLKGQARQNLNSEKGKELRKRRANEVESIFGDEKLNKLKRRYNLRGIKKVSLEAGLYYISHNLRRIYTIRNKNITKKKILTIKTEINLLQQTALSVAI